MHSQRHIHTLTDHTLTHMMGRVQCAVSLRNACPAAQGRASPSDGTLDAEPQGPLRILSPLLCHPLCAPASPSCPSSSPPRHPGQQASLGSLQSSDLGPGVAGDPQGGGHKDLRTANSHHFRDLLSNHSQPRLAVGGQMAPPQKSPRPCLLRAFQGPGPGPPRTPRMVCRTKGALLCSISPSLGWNHERPSIRNE